jgi:spermidine synthase
VAPPCLYIGHRSFPSPLRNFAPLRLCVNSVPTGRDRKGAKPLRDAKSEHDKTRFLNQLPHLILHHSPGAGTLPRVPDFFTYPIRSDKLTMTVKVDRALLHQKTKYQTIDIVETAAFGRMMFLDGHVQLSEMDECAYHECLIHIPLMSVANPKSALVIGGGDGAALRELCKWPLERIEMVEIDGEVVEASKKVWPELSNGAFENPRVKVHIEDAFEFVKIEARNSESEISNLKSQSLGSKSGVSHRKSQIGNPQSAIRNPKSYDLIVLDVTDVYEDTDSSLSQSLFTKKFYKDCKRLLAPGGFLVTEADNPVFCWRSTAEIEKALKEVFENVGIYHTIVPSFGGLSAYCWASADARLAIEWSERKAPKVLRFLDAERYSTAFHGLPLRSPI